MSEVLVDQPTAKPTRKIAAVGIAGIVAPLVSVALLTVFPDLSEMCGDEAAMALTVLILGALQGAATFLAGYMKREAVTARP